MCLGGMGSLGSRAEHPTLHTARGAGLAWALPPKLGPWFLGPEGVKFSVGAAAISLGRGGGRMVSLNGPKGWGLDTVCTSPPLVVGLGGQNVVSIGLGVGGLAPS